MSGPMTLYLKSGNQVIVDKNGLTTVSGKTTVPLFGEGEKYQVVNLKNIEVSDSDVLLFVGIGSPVSGDEVPSQSYNLVGRLNLKTGKYIWRSKLNSYEEALPPILYKNVVILAVSNLIYGLSYEKGDLVWGFWTNSGYVESFAIQSIAENAGTLSVGSPIDGTQKVLVELDALTGHRVYKATKYKTPEVRPFYDEKIRGEIIFSEGRSRSSDRDFPFQGMAKKFPRNEEDHLPAPVPADWDGVVVGLTTLLWSLKTGEGIILNPIKNDVEAIVKAAKEKSVQLKGKVTPVQWLYVLSTKKIYEKSNRPTRQTALGLWAEKYPLKKLVYPKAFDAPDFEMGGEELDIEAVAQALHAKPLIELDKAIMTEAGPLIPKNEKTHSLYDESENRGSFLALEWGPYQIGMTHIRLIPSVSVY